MQSRGVQVRHSRQVQHDVVDLDSLGGFPGPCLVQVVADVLLEALQQAVERIAERRQGRGQQQRRQQRASFQGSAKPLHQVTAWQGDIAPAPTSAFRKESMPSIRSTTTLLIYSASGLSRLSLQQLATTQLMSGRNPQSNLSQAAG